MKTEELIRALVADGRRPVTPVSRLILQSLACGAIITAGLFLVALHPRPDLATALQTPAFLVKLLFAVLLSAAAITTLPQSARPDRRHHRLWILAVAPALLAGSVIIELSTQPPALWSSRLIGHNAVHCLSIIPLLSFAPAVSLFLALRRGAPSHPATAGALAGLASGAIGAALYALTCPDDSPLFVAAWYSTAIIAVTGLAAAAGRRLLRW